MKSSNAAYLKPSSSTALNRSSSSSRGMTLPADVSPNDLLKKHFKGDVVVGTHMDDDVSTAIYALLSSGIYYHAKMVGKTIRVHSTAHASTGDGHLKTVSEIADAYLSSSSPKSH